MPQNPNHITPPPNSQAAAYGYTHAGSLASQGMTPSHTLTKPGNMAYGGSVSVGLVWRKLENFICKIAASVGYLVYS